MRLFASHGTAREVMKMIFMKSAGLMCRHVSDSSNTWHERASYAHLERKSLNVYPSGICREERNVRFIPQDSSRKSRTAGLILIKFIIEARLACFDVFTGPPEAGIRVLRNKRQRQSGRTRHWVAFVHFYGGIPE